MTATLPLNRIFKSEDTSPLLVNPDRRWFDPTIGRWLNEDPIGLADGPNPQIYAHNSPTNAIDPDGLKVIDTGVRIAYGWQKSSVIFSWFPVHGFIVVGGAGYGFFSKDNTSTGPGLVRDNDLKIYPHVNSSTVKTGEFYSTWYKRELDDCLFDIDVYKKAVKEYIDKRTKAPGSYSVGARDCFEFVAQADRYGLLKAARDAEVRHAVEEGQFDDPPIIVAE